MWHCSDMADDGDWSKQEAAIRGAVEKAEKAQRAVVQRIQSYILAGMPPQQAFDAVGWSRSTFYRRLRELDGS